MANVLSNLFKWRVKRRLKIHEGFQAIFSGPEGQNVLMHICEQGFVFKSTHVTGDPCSTAFNEGKRELALKILKFVHRDHAELVKMVEQKMKQYEKP